MKQIQVSKEIWQIIHAIKKENNMKHCNQVVKILIEQFFTGEKTIENKPENIIDNSEESDKLYEIDDERNNQSVENINQTVDEFSLDKKTYFRVSSKENDIEPMNRSGQNDTYIPFNGRRSGLRSYHMKKQFFPQKITNEEPSKQIYELRCNNCGHINVVHHRFSNGYIICSYCNERIKI